MVVVDQGILEQIAQLKAAGLHPPASVLAANRVSKLNVIEFGERHFYIPETNKPIVLEPFQKIILRIITGTHNYPGLRPFYSTILWSAIKKVGKTAISGLHARWRAEQSTFKDEILFFANDETQSRGRAYAAVQTSIELDPRYDKQKRVLYDEHGSVRWRVIEDYLEHVPTGTKVRAVNVDYRGEAGANPSATYWTEAHGFNTPKQEKLYDEMTPVLTRTNSQRYVESYAGYRGKSKVLEKLWNLAVDAGRQLTLDDVPDWPWPDEYNLPLYVNDAAGVFAYIDQGMQARLRVPWTQGPIAEQYYAEQALTLTPEEFERLHLNYWATETSAFIPIEWWLACEDATILPLDNMKNTPIVIAADASVSGDCTALVGVSRNPGKYQDVVLRFAYKWDPPRGGKLDYDNTPNQLTGESLRDCLLRLIKQYNIIETAYDEWQLHYLMTEIKNEGLVWVRPFSQASARDVADKQLYDLIKTRRITYNPNDPNVMHEAMRQHLQNAARKQRANEDTKLHIVKSAEASKIDLTVALSMACAECLRLDL